VLILSRKQDEVIVIGENIRITVLEIKGRSVRLGVSAPDGLDIDRLELHEAKKATRRMLE
jgi:carbon storage regulator